MKELLKKLRWNGIRDITKLSVREAGENVLPSESAYDFLHEAEFAKVYNMMADQESQKLLRARAHYARDCNQGPLFQFLFESKRDGNPIDCISVLRDKYNGAKTPLIMYGCSRWAKEIVDGCLNIGINFDYICAGNDLSMFTLGDSPLLTGASYRGIPVISEKILLKKHRSAEVITGDVMCWQAKDYLINKGFPAEHIWPRQIEYGKQYFDEAIITPHEHEVFIDGGVLNLQTTLDFIKWCGGHYDAVYAFEPDFDSYQLSLNRMKTELRFDAEKIQLLYAAAWKKDETVKFTGGLLGASYIGGGDKTVEVSARSIDSVLNGAPVSFIKLDVEGSELSALQGAEMSIRNHKPRLAISVYHKPEDIIEIPLYIHSLVPEYKMYMRHYSTCNCETVLYCVM